MMVLVTAMAVNENVHNFSMNAQTLHIVLLPILVKSFPLNKDFVTYETLGFICIPNAKAETKL